MRTNETLLSYSDMRNDGGYRVRIYDSSVDFTQRDFFSHRHSDFEISYILQGSGVYRLRDGICEIGQGDIFVFGSNQVHCITERKSESLILLNVQFEPRMIWSPLSNMLSKDHAALFRGKCERLLQDTQTHTFITEKMLEIRREGLEKRPGYPIMIKACLCQIIAQLMREYDFPAEEERMGKRRDKLISMDLAMTYINEHLDSALTLEQIAGFAGLTRTYFSTKFNELNGLTPWDYITIRRIEKSKTLLISLDDSVLEIAGKCGYDNLSNFNRAFARTVGMTPSAYRKMHKN